MGKKIDKLKLKLKKERKLPGPGSYGDINDLTGATNSNSVM